MTDSTGSGTSGGGAGTSGMSAKLLLALLLLAMLGYAVIQTLANVSSIITDQRAAGREPDLFSIWVAEGSSLAAWLVMIAVIWWAVKTFRPPRLAWPLALAAHAAMTVPVSLGHVGLMVLLREIVWWAFSRNYDFSSDLSASLLYEYRKDVATYVQLALIALLIQWIVSRYEAHRGEGRPVVLSVPDGSVTHRVPVDEIDHVAAAGNYVELAWGGRALLHRATLASMERELGADFARIHRSRLVRRAAIRKVETNQSGDFTVALGGGETLKGSRRYRGNLS